MAETPSKRTPAKAAPAPAPASADETSTTPAAPVQDPAPAPAQDNERPDVATGHTTEDGVVSSAPVPGEDVDAATKLVQEATTADPADHQAAGQSFYNAATTGSGTILPDGTYGDPLPDPQVQRVAKDEDAQIK